MLRAKRGTGTYDGWNNYEHTPPQQALPGPAPRQKLLRRLIETGLNFVGSAVYVLSAAALILDYRHNDRISSLLMVALTTMFAFFFLARTTPPQEANTSPRDWLVATAGTAIPLLLRPAAAVHDFAITEALQFVGICVSITGLLALNNSFGMVAANRGVKTGGIYRYIRHPIYAGYVLASSGFLVQNFTLFNAAVMAAWMALEFGRMGAEEKLLSRDPAYAAYMKRTPWRIIPFVF